MQMGYINNVAQHSSGVVMGEVKIQRIPCRQKPTAGTIGNFTALPPVTVAPKSQKGISLALWLHYHHHHSSK